MVKSCFLPIRAGLAANISHFFVESFVRGALDRGETCNACHVGHSKNSCSNAEANYQSAPQSGHHMKQGDYG